MAESSNTSESLDNQTSGSELTSRDVEPQHADRQDHESQLAEVSKLLREGPNDGEDADDSVTSRDTDSDAPPRDRDSEEASPKSLREIADSLQVPVEELYKLSIPMPGGGESKTLGELKDLAVNQSEFHLRELQSEEARVKREAELARTEQELQELISAIPEKAMKPEALEKVRTAREQKAARERAKVMELMPEWEHSEKRTADLEGMINHLQDYGFPPSFLASVSDARMMKYIRENWMRQQRIERALNSIGEKVPQSHGKSRTAPQGKTKSNQGKSPSRTINQQVQQVSQLLQHGTE